MADLMDDADKITEAHLRYSLTMRKPVPEKRGTCLWCIEPCAGAYCSSDCRDDHQQYLRRQSDHG